MTARAPNKRPAYEPPARLLKPVGFQPDMPRPASTVAGGVLVMLRVLAGVFVLVALAAGWSELAAEADITIEGFDPTPEGEALALWFVLGVGGTVLLFEALMAFLIFRGHNGPRVIVMLISVVSISSAFAAWWVQDQEITIEGTFVAISLDILVLLALSSRSAAAYARRLERR